MVIIGVSLLLLSGGIIGFLVLLTPKPKYPVPPREMPIDQVEKFFQIPETTDLKGVVNIQTTPEGFRIENGSGVQLLLKYKYGKTMIIVVFIRFDDDRSARSMAERILSYVGNFSRNYTKWDWTMDARHIALNFEYPGLITEMWSKKNWIVEVVVGESGDIGYELLDSVRESISMIPGAG